MFEPEVWKMVRELEREHTDRQMLWRLRIAQEHRAEPFPVRFWRRVRPAHAHGSAATGASARTERTAGPARRRAVSGDGG